MDKRTCSSETVADMCVDMCIDMCRGHEYGRMYRHVHRLVYAAACGPVCRLGMTRNTMYGDVARQYETSDTVAKQESPFYFSAISLFCEKGPSFSF